MSTLIAPPAPQQELDELVDRLGSQAAVARLLDREPVQIMRWRREEARLQPATVELIDGAWNAINLLAERVEPGRLETVVEQRWPGLGLRSPAQLIREREFETLFTALVTGSAISPLRPVDEPVEHVDEDSPEAFFSWFGEQLSERQSEAASVIEDEADSEPDELELIGPSYTEAWRDGSAVSPARTRRSS